MLLGMTTAPLAHTDVIVLDYLAALWQQSEDLGPELRDELMSTVADYIALRRTSPAAPLEAPAEIIRRLGPPEALVAAMRRGHLPPHIRLPALVPPPSPAATGGGAAESAAVGLLTAGAFAVPGVAPVAGMLLASGSPHWTPAEKTTGWMFTLGSGAAAVVLMLVFVTGGFDAATALLLGYLMATAGSFLAGRHLLEALRRPR